jgi:RES domain-containing protein
MLSGPALTKALTACQMHAVALRGLMFRAIHLSWFDPLATARPLFASAGGPGSRYVPPNGPAALYAAPEFETAYREMNQDFYAALARPGGAALATMGALRPEPAVVISVHVNVSRVLDLRIPVVLQLLNTTTAQLLAPWKNVPNPTATQQLGDAVFQGNWFEGIVFQSAQHANYSCLVLFRQRLLAKPAIHFQGFQLGMAPNKAAGLADDQLP